MSDSIVKLLMPGLRPVVIAAVDDHISYKFVKAVPHVKVEIWRDGRKTGGDFFSAAGGYIPGDILNVKITRGGK